MNDGDVPNFKLWVLHQNIRRLSMILVEMMDAASCTNDRQTVTGSSL